MILLSGLHSIGYVQKTHGIKGELSIVLNSDFEDLDFNCFIFEMDGIFVPFFAGEWRFKTATTALLKLDGIAGEPQSRAFVGKTIYISKEEAASNDDSGDDVGIQFYTGYRMEDKVGGVLGTILSVDDSTENLLFEVQASDSVLLIPAVDDWVVEIDDVQKVLYVDLPEGLVQINDADDKSPVF